MNNTNEKYYHGHIYSVDFIAWESRVNKIAIGTQIICLLEINGKLKKIPMLEIAQDFIHPKFNKSGISN